MTYIATNLFSLLYYMVRHGILNWGEQQRQHVELLKLRQQVARQQFFPHFMKNTLSALRALSRRDRARSIRCADLLTALFMYCVKNRDTRFVLLEEELEQVDRLLEIYSLRQDDSDIMLDIRMGLGISKKTSIPYMLLLTLIENACEYGICTDEHRPILVDIFCITPGSLTIRVMNWIPEVQKHNPAATGQGLKLLQDYVVALDPTNTICVEQAGQCFEVVITLHIVSF
ncbi:Histidine kinase [Sphingobacterium nematocida]|uniref:Histidine kinase n=1 Tax=Sphingobacterium nematocida TaxID=1513896 RepID=A0A1T5GR18_9SPHI|nr:histidine kinase [Sphingobacterium nematocida]SKC10853.1 Histidine kinase [Sphingobacterium nematocida]